MKIKCISVYEMPHTVPTYSRYPINVSSLPSPLCSLPSSPPSDFLTQALLYSQLLKLTVLAVD